MSVLCLLCTLASCFNKSFVLLRNNATLSQCLHSRSSWLFDFNKLVCYFYVLVLSNLLFWGTYSATPDCAKGLLLALSSHHF